MIGILYESDEWSLHKLAAELERRGKTVSLFNMQEKGNEAAILQCSLLVNRVFASAVFRGHGFTLERMGALFKLIEQRGIPLINPAEAHFYEISKAASTEKLKQLGLAVPQVFACDIPEKLNEDDFGYPCIIKPNCGGRTTYTVLARTASEAQSFLAAAPDMPFIVQQYIEPEKGFLTRVEIIGYQCALISKRSIATNGLASYHLGSAHLPYPNPGKELQENCERAARELSLELSSFDLIENGANHYFIDVNAVSNVAEDCTELLNYDLMTAYADYLV